MRNRKQRGIALLTAIWVLAVLLVLVAGFAAMVHSEMAVARNFGQLAQARWAARTGIRQAEAQLLELTKEPSTSLGESRLTLTPAEEDSAPGQTTYQTIVDDEAGKLNINTAPREMLEAFFTPEVVDALIDWRDEDSTQEEQGAEDEYYSGLSTPYHCKNGPLTTVRELLLVKGVTREMLAATLTEDGRTLEELLTVSSVDENTDADGEERVNISSATQETLSSEFGTVLSEEEIQAIIKQRTSSAFETPADLLRVTELKRETVAQIYDRLTTETEKTHAGLVNINTAPTELLMAIPGFTDAIAEAIVQRRNTEGPFTTVGDLLEMQQVTDSAFMSAAKYLTVRSKVFGLTSTGQFDDGVRQTITCILRVESSGGTQTVRVLYWRE